MPATTPVSLLKKWRSVALKNLSESPLMPDQERPLLMVLDAPASPAQYPTPAPVICAVYMVLLVPDGYCIHCAKDGVKNRACRNNSRYFFIRLFASNLAKFRAAIVLFTGTKLCTDVCSVQKSVLCLRYYFILSILDAFSTNVVPSQTRDYSALRLQRKSLTHTSPRKYPFSNLIAGRSLGGAPL